MFRVLRIIMRRFPLNGTGSTFLMGVVGGAEGGEGAREASKEIPWNGDRGGWTHV
jgi:hypothetical protein